MKTIALTATATMLALGATAAHAQMETRPYVSGGVTMLEYGPADLNALTGRAGLDIGENFGVEAEASFGLNSDFVGATEMDLDHRIAGFGRLRAPLSPNLEAFVRGGYYFADGDATTAGITADLDDDDFAGGAGLQWNIAGPHAIRADYTNYGFDGDGHSGTLSYAFRF